MTFFKMRPPAHGRRRRTRLELEVLEDRWLPSVIYNQGVSGPLSANQAAPTALTLGLGTNSIIATVGTGDNQNWVTLHVPAGLNLSSIVLASYLSSDHQGFIGVQRGTSFVGNPFSAASYLGYAHFGTGATNGSLPATNLVGTDILPIMGNNTIAQGSQGFTPPLSSGDYSFLIQQQGASTNYQFDFDTKSVPVQLQSIAVTPANPSVAKGQTQQFTATGTFSDNSKQNVTSQVTWASATSSVATITAAGLASGVGVGTSTISAKLNGITGSTVLTVTAAVLQSIAVTPANPSVAQGQTQQFTATGTFSDSSKQDLTSQVTWASATSSVATVTAAGLASGVGVGTSTISAKLSGITGSTVLTVTAAAPLATNHFQITAPATAAAGTPVAFTVTALDQNNTPTGSAYTGTVHFTSTDGSATFPSNMTLTNGTGTFSVTFKTPGAQTISTSDTVSPGITGISGTVAVSAVASQLAVSAPSSVTAGTPFIVTVTAQDGSGHTAAGYTGIVAITTSGGSPVLPANATLANGVGSFLVTLKTVASGPWTVTAKDTVNPTITGTSGAIAVSPGAVSFFTVVVPASATTGSPIPVTVTAMDANGNVATSYAGHVHFTSTDGGAGLPGDATLSGGTGIFNVTLNTAGSQSIAVADTAATNPIITGASAAITTRGLTVTAFTPTADGFTVAFSKAFDPSKLTLYGSDPTTVRDVTLTGNTNGVITGTLIVDPSDKSVTFKATQAALASFFGTDVLPDDTYHVTLVSGTTNGFGDGSEALDGLGNGGTANYTAPAFTIANSGKEVLSVPDFARGPDGSHNIQVPNDRGHGIPITLTNAANVTDVTFNLIFDPTLLTIAGGLGGSGSDATDPGGSFMMLLTPPVAGQATFRFHDATPQSGTVILGDILAMVPVSAAGKYKAKELLSLGSISLNGAAFTGVVADGVHVNAYLGDVTGNGTIDALDVATANNVAGGSATGFAAYTLLDPAIVGDPQGDVSVDAGDVTALAANVSHLPTPTIPVIPTGLSITPTGPDPTLSLQASRGGEEEIGRRGDSISPASPPLPFSPSPLLTVTVQLDHPHPAGSAGMTEAVLALTYDPSALSVSAADITLGSIPGLGTGWQISSVVDQATGQIGITLFSTTAITAAQGGSLVNIAFHVAPGAAVPATVVQLVSSVLVDGRQFVTQVDDALGQYVLSPGMDRLTVVSATH